MKRGRAYTRHQSERAKAKALNLIRGWGWSLDEIEPRDIGIVAGGHAKRCSCPECGNPRRHFGELTVQERKQIMPERLQLNGYNIFDNEIIDRYA